MQGGGTAREGCRPRYVDVRTHLSFERLEMRPESSDPI